MKFIVKLHPEISIKSKSVRKRFTKMLETNMRNVLRRVDEQVAVINCWDKFEVKTKSTDPNTQQALINRLKQIPGVVQFLEVQQSSYTDLEDIYQQVKAVHGESLAGKTFCVRTKRRGKHEFTSTEVDRYVGGGLNQYTDALGVKLKNPDVTVHLEVDGEQLFIVKHKHLGMGGFPIATQEDVLSLISGGFDSTVSSYQMIRKGSRTHYCFFNLGGKEHEIGVKQVSHYIWQTYSRSHKVKFFKIDFEPVVAEILEKVDNGQMGVVLKRMMMRAASAVAKNAGIQALVTGESLGQVSSQTLTNLNVIDRVTETLILRPLIAMDKQEIIDIARSIGTEDFAKTMPEFCGVISNKPTVKAVLSKIEAEEAKMNPQVLEDVVNKVDVMDIRDIEHQANEEVNSVETVSELGKNHVIIDVRAPEEEEESPLEIDGVEVIAIPFYKVATQFVELDQSKHYLLYCQKGVMSKLQALLLHENGFTNVDLYQP